MTDLPPPDVDVTSSESLGNHKVNVKIHRSTTERNYTATAGTKDDAFKDVIKQIIVDPHSLEWQPAAKKP